MSLSLDKSALIYYNLLTESTEASQQLLKQALGTQHYIPDNQ